VASGFFHAGFLLRLFLDPLKIEAKYSSETLIYFQWRYIPEDVTLITTAVRTSNPKELLGRTDRLRYGEHRNRKKKWGDRKESDLINLKNLGGG
jgi:hypothetical protein